MILESEVEQTLKRKLTDYGFLVLKLYTPGHIGVMDRMILRPRYSPGPPMFVEVKRPGKRVRKLQRAVGEDWKRRGAEVLSPVSSLHEVEQLCHDLIGLVAADYAFAQEADL